jgi:hypothetical protein
MNHSQPFGRVSARDRERRRGGWDMRFGILMVFPLVCLVVVLYEFLYLQQFTTSDATATSANTQRLRADDAAPTSVIRGRRTMVLIANYRDSKRCAETLRSIFDNAVSPELIRISIYDQIYEAENEIECIEAFCQLMGEAKCRRSQLVSSKIDALNATVSASLLKTREINMTLRPALATTMGE